MSRKKFHPTHQRTSELALSSFHARFEQLEKDRQWLLKHIQRKQTELRNFLEQMRSVAIEIAQRSEPFHKKLVQLDREIHGLFEEIFTTRKFGKGSRKKIEQVYRLLQMMGPISPKADEAEENSDEYWTDEDSTDGENKFHGAENSSPNHENSNANADLKQMRSTFLRLASIFHPDKVTNQEDREDYAEIMKEINRAYEAGDLARLLEIERQYEVNQSIDLENASNSEIEKQCLALETDNQLLKTQYEQIKAELRWMRRTPEGEMVKEYRTLVRQGFDPIEEIIGDAERHLKELENVRNFVADFRDKKITIKDFLQGPSSANRPSEAELKEMMEELVADMLIYMDL